MLEAPTVELANGVRVPALGLGTWPMDDAQAEVAVAEALRMGYRLIDTAENYGNEVGVGRGIRASGIDRDEVVVTTKFNERWHGRTDVHQAFANSARRLGLDRIDLLLIHWPNPGRDRYVDAWRGMLELLEDGRVCAIGVSNFKPPHLERLLEATGVAPHVNQIELDPRHSRREERAFDADHGILTQSWSPIGAGGDLLADATIVEIAARLGRTPAQVVLRWHVELGLVPIPKTSQPARMAENLDVFHFELHDDDLRSLAGLDGSGDDVVDADRFGH